MKPAKWSKEWLSLVPKQRLPELLKLAQDNAVKYMPIHRMAAGERHWYWQQVAARIEDEIAAREEGRR